MDDDTFVMWGIVNGKTVIHGVTIENDGFSVTTSPDGATFIAADEIVGMERGERHPRGGHVLRIEHSATGVPSPVALCMGMHDPARRAIEGLRPDVLTEIPPPLWWKTSAARIYAFALAIILIGVVLAIV